MRFLLLLVVSLYFSDLTAQVGDSSQVRDSAYITAQGARTSNLVADSIISVDSAAAVMAKDPLRELLKDNFLLINTAAVAYPAVPRNRVNQEFDFYYILFLFFFAGILRAVYPRYFANMFRVFFNTSLRQGQLTDQLLQARFTSMVFNLFFAFSSGFFIYQFLQFANVIPEAVNLRVLMMVTAALTVMYSSKYLVLKFTGWMSGFRKEAETYIFIVFLVNKILGIILLPLSLVLAFSQKGIAEVVAVVSLMIVLVLFLLRFFRSYGILQHHIHVNRFHFFLYILGVEILPLLLIYKAAVGLLLNNA